MSSGKSEFENSVVSNPNLSIVYKKGAKYTEVATEPTFPSLIIDPAHEQPQPTYAGVDPDFMPACHDMYFQKPEPRRKDKRRHSRVSMSNSKVCVKNERGESVVAEIINLSRGGVYFQSSAEFAVGSLVSVATHYIEGGLNIFQDAKIVRVQRKPSGDLPGEYAVQFSPRPKDSASSHPAKGKTGLA